MFPPDKFKKNNDGTWRAFEKYHYRISYRITADDFNNTDKRKVSFLTQQFVMIYS